ncbi:nuclear transport factor 2 family protein [Actinomadura rugatobispora]|uniref:Nuclear transport factor 2 family protein n=1 Tax=Actinomadura rugatobispora TaxID=1994 RepID=A0ABW1AB14_9ACTN|nr:nuclear transport factor 2 family protein [Actinomadura rugatobispora]
MTAMTGVERVLLDYATAIDTKDWELFGALFDPDCTMTTAAGTISGAPALTRHMRDLHAPLDASAHRVTNVDIAETADGATARSYLDALLVRAGHPEGPTFRVVGFYDDELRRSAGGWVILHRAFRAIWREGNAAVLGVPGG